MTSISFFFLFIPILASILLLVNFLLAPHNPYQEKDSVFECGFHSFLGQNRSEFSISFFIFALLFLLFDLEILLVFPLVVSMYTNSIFGIITMLIFFIVLTLGFAFELGKKALYIDSRQYDNNNDNNSEAKHKVNTKGIKSSVSETKVSKNTLDSKKNEEVQYFNVITNKTVPAHVILNKINILKRDYSKNIAFSEKILENLYKRIYFIQFKKYAAEQAWNWKDARWLHERFALLFELALAINTNQHVMKIIAQNNFEIQDKLMADIETVRAPYIQIDNLKSSRLCEVRSNLTNHTIGLYLNNAEIFSCIKKK